MKGRHTSVGWAVLCLVMLASAAGASAARPDRLAGTLPGGSPPAPVPDSPLGPWSGLGLLACRLVVAGGGALAARRRPGGGR